MAAHHQTYQFQVDIHALWGNLLGAFAGFRFLTYFFLFLRPPSSILPSRPPTEALASLALTCGGVVFILSVEQVTFAAMRHHADDVMVSSLCCVPRISENPLTASPSRAGFPEPHRGCCLCLVLLDRLLVRDKGCAPPSPWHSGKRQLADAIPNDPSGWALSRTARATSSSLRAKLYTP